MHIRIGHIYLGPEHHRTLLELTVVHTLKQFKVFLYRTIAVRAVLTGFGRRTLLRGNLFARLLIHISLSFTDHPFGKVEKLREIIRSIIKTVFPIISEPMDVPLYCLHIFSVLLLRVSVVKTQIACASELFSRTEVHNESLGMAYVQVSVGFRRKACIEPASVFASLQIGLYLLLYEVEAVLIDDGLVFNFSHNLFV